MMSERPWGQVYAERGSIETSDDKRETLRIMTKGKVGQGYTTNPSKRIKVRIENDPAPLR